MVTFSILFRSLGDSVTSSWMRELGQTSRPFRMTISLAKKSKSRSGEYTIHIFPNNYLYVVTSGNPSPLRTKRNRKESRRSHLHYTLLSIAKELAFMQEVCSDGVALCAAPLPSQPCAALAYTSSHLTDIGAVRTRETGDQDNTPLPYQNTFRSPLTPLRAE